MLTISTKTPVTLVLGDPELVATAIEGNITRTITAFSRHPQAIFCGWADQRHQFERFATNFNDGILVLDGMSDIAIHHSQQCHYWMDLMQMADQQSLQIIATTQSWDSIKGALEASLSTEVNVSAIRIDKSADGRDYRAVDYSRWELECCIKQRIECR